jgi:hypothetical protein
MVLLPGNIFIQRKIPVPKQKKGSIPNQMTLLLLEWYPQNSKILFVNMFGIAW